MTSPQPKRLLAAEGTRGHRTDAPAEAADQAAIQRRRCRTTTRTPDRPDHPRGTMGLASSPGHALTSLSSWSITAATTRWYGRRSGTGVLLHRRPTTMYEVDLGLHRTVITAGPAEPGLHRVIPRQHQRSMACLRPLCRRTPPGPGHRGSSLRRPFCTRRAASPETSAIDQVTAAEDKINDQLGGVAIDVTAPTGIAAGHALGHRAADASEPNTGCGHAPSPI